MYKVINGIVLSGVESSDLGVYFTLTAHFIWPSCFLRMAAILNNVNLRASSDVTASSLGKVYGFRGHIFSHPSFIFSVGSMRKSSNKFFFVPINAHRTQFPAFTYPVVCLKGPLPLHSLFASREPIFSSHSSSVPKAIL